MFDAVFFDDVPEEAASDLFLFEDVFLSVLLFFFEDEDELSDCSVSSSSKNSLSSERFSSSSIYSSSFSSEFTAFA